MRKPVNPKKIQRLLDDVICLYIDSNPNEDDYLNNSIRDLMEWARKEARMAGTLSGTRMFRLYSEKVF